MKSELHLVLNRFRTARDATDHATNKTADAWLLVGSSPKQWLAEILHWQCDESALRIRCLPETRRFPADLRSDAPALRDTATPNTAENKSRRAGILVDGVDTVPRGGAKIPYRRLQPAATDAALFVPLDAALVPEVSDAELAELLRFDSIHDFVWTPRGLVGFSSREIYGVDCLLTGPPRDAVDWDRAQPGVHLNRAIVSIEPIGQTGVDDVLAIGREDIGSQPLQTGDLPRYPGESRTPATGPLLGKMLRPAARLAQKVSAALARREAAQRVRRANEQKADPDGNRAAERLKRKQNSATGNSGPTWHAQLGNWANSILNGTHRLFENRRERELNRLLAMLKSDPDRGLRFAIPFGGSGAARGIAPPGDRLVEQNIRFHLDGGGSGPADYWSMSIDMQARLIRQYRELAEREQALGRYRRAAYIYAQLLNDYARAASVLMAGGHFHEAVVIYRDKLALPREAARCLEQGGMWLEAAEAWEELKNWKAAAALYEKLELGDKARDNWLRAAEDARSAGQFLEAAELHEMRLGDLETALEILEQGWISGEPPEDFLQQIFLLFARHNQHARAEQKIVELRDLVGVLRREQMKVGVLSQQAEKYPERHVQILAADATRRIAARQLTQAAEPRLFLNAVRKLQPGDRLLARDCRRFEQEFRANELQRQTQQSSTSRRTPKFCHSVQLDPKTKWESVVASNGKFVAVGYRLTDTTSELRLGVINLGSDFTLKHYSTQTFPVPTRNPLLFSEVQPAAGKTQIFIHSDDAITEEVIASSQYVRRAVAPGEASVRIRAIAMSSAGVEWQLREDLVTLEMTLSGFHVGGSRPALIHSLQRERGALISCGISVLAQNRLFVSMNDKLVEVGGTFPAGMETMLSGHLIHSMFLPMGRRWLGITHDDGGSVFYPESGTLRRFGHGLQSPVACFTAQGSLVAADESGIIETYNAQVAGCELTASFHPERERPIAVLPLPMGSPAGFLIVYENGEANLYSMP